MVTKPPAYAVFLKRNPWVYGIIVLLIVAGVGTLIYQSTRPKQGGVAYGICRTLLDFEFSYPFTYDFLSVAEGERDVRMFMAETNTFGNERIVQVDCEFSTANNKLTLTNMALDRKPISKPKLEQYNRMLPTLAAMGDTLNRDLPKPMPRSLDKLKR